MTDNINFNYDLNVKLIDTINSNLCELSNLANLDDELKFNLIEESLNQFVNNFLLPTDKNSEKNYSKNKNN